MTLELDNLPPMLVASEVATLLRIKTKSVWERRRLGKPPQAVKVGGRLLYPRDDVLALLRPTAEPAANDSGTEVRHG
ncbi:MAG: helix-turn-helix transcriptional regulator [Nannocystales bacterium]